MGDRNFGVFWVAYVAHRRQHVVVLRLTEGRARKLYGGRLIAAPGRLPGAMAGESLGRQEGTYHLATGCQRGGTADGMARGSWQVQTVVVLVHQSVVARAAGRLQHLSAKTLGMLQKELLIAVSAYNFVRAVMCLAARRAGLQPRQLSFSFVLDVVHAAWPKLVTANSGEEN